MGSLKGYAWNCGGLRDSTALTRSKVAFFEKEFKDNFDIFFFAETHHKSEQEIPQEILRFGATHHIVHSPVAENETHTGLIGLIRKDYDLISTKDLIQGRLMNLKLQEKAEKINYNINVAVY